MAEEKLLIKEMHKIAILTINNPPSNVLCSQTLAELDVALTKAMDSARIRGIILTGQGEKIFAAGADIRDLETFDEAKGVKAVTRDKEVFAKLFESSKPSVAALNGHALGGGLEMACSCDFRVAVKKAKLGVPEINLGVLPSLGGTQILPWLIGGARAKSLLLTGDAIKAQEALEIGLVDRLVDEDELMGEAMEMAVALSGKPPLAYQGIKKALRAAMEMPFSEALKEETRLFGRLCATQDKIEGVRAFLEKRPARFKGL